MKPLRTIADMNPETGSRATNMQVCVHLSTPPLSSRIRQARLFFFVRLCRHASEVHVLLACMSRTVEGSWMNLVCGYLLEMRDGDDTLRSLPTPHDDPIPWILDVRGDHSSWKARIRKYVKQSMFLVPSQPVPPSVVHDEAAERDEGVHVCETCGKSFSKLPSLRTHQFSVHGLRNPIAKKVVGTSCMACGTNFHTRAR
eukprot:7993080-Alexandrium_andersonii.AAC.1